jgi:membrane-bound lytic murein transglycosylase A
LVWLETKVPKKPGDYIGQKVGLLASIQDTGSAIKGPFRGDLYFGSGVVAGLRAGVMKHKAEWRLLVPKNTYFSAEPKGDR